MMALWNFKYFLFLSFLTLVQCSPSVTLNPVETHTSVPGHPNQPGDQHGQHTGEEHEHTIHVSTVDFPHVATPFIISVWIIFACFAKIAFHMMPKLGHIFPESVILIVIGILIGLALFYTDSLTPPLTPTTFFLFMLPPIILDAGYFMPNHMFFNNLGTILLFAVIGTIWNTFTIGLSLWGLGYSGIYGIHIDILPMFLFSALISAVDPVAVLAVFEEIHVNEVLYIVVFGESLLNDAVTVVLYHIFEGFSAMGQEKVTVGEVAKGIASFPVVALGGTAIGIIWGFVIGFTTRFTHHSKVVEPCFIFLMAYLSYLNAEIFHMSGILAITFCGITMKNYVEANISQKSHTTVKYGMKMLASSSETLIFIYLGVATVQDAHEWNWAFVIATIVFCSVFRILGVIIFTWWVNKYRLHKLSVTDQFVMSYGGLRGAVAFALVLLIEPETVRGDETIRRMFVTTTITMVFFTVFVQGITIKPLVQWLKVAKADKQKPTMNERIHEKLMEHVMAMVEGVLGQVGHYKMRQWFKNMDNWYIRPLLVREGKGDEPKILETFSRISHKQGVSPYSKRVEVELGGSRGSTIFHGKDKDFSNFSQVVPTGLVTRKLSAQQLQIQQDQRRFSISMLNDCKGDQEEENVHTMRQNEINLMIKQQARRLSYSRHNFAEEDDDDEPTITGNYYNDINDPNRTGHRDGGELRQRGNLNSNDAAHINMGFVPDNDAGRDVPSIFVISHDDVRNCFGGTPANRGNTGNDKENNCTKL